MTSKAPRHWLGQSKPGARLVSAGVAAKSFFSFGCKVFKKWP